MVLLEPGAHFALHRLNHQWLAPLGPGKCFFGRFLLGLSRIRRSKVMSMLKITSATLKIQFMILIDLVYFLGQSVCDLIIMILEKGWSVCTSDLILIHCSIHYAC